MTWEIEIGQARLTDVAFVRYYGGIIYKFTKGPQTRQADSRGWNDNNLFHVENHGLI